MTRPPGTFCATLLDLTKVSPVTLMCTKQEHIHSVKFWSYHYFISYKYRLHVSTTFTFCINFMHQEQLQSGESGKKSTLSEMPDQLYLRCPFTFI